MEDALTFWDGGKLRRSDMSVVPKANKYLSPVGAAYSGKFPDDAAPERSLDCLGFDYSTNMSALTGLVPSLSSRPSRDTIRVHSWNSCKRPQAQNSVPLYVAPRVAYGKKSTQFKAF
jgi:hypothetical protein